jgi:hypothetical protein|tara:strand:- start:47 stop:820 length:774 start_codon:yes stop_codon:yes gene_type:complete
MAKYRYRIEGGRYGGEAVIGEVNPAFASYYVERREELVDAVLESEDWAPEDEVDSDALLDPEGIPHPAIPGEDFYMWENDDIEHINSAYADGGFSVYEVPADGSDDWDYDKETYDGDAIFVYGREGGYFSNEEPETINEEDEDGNKYVPVLMFHSSEKGGFGAWFVDSDEPFDEFKLGYGVVETNLAEFVDSVYYDKVELDCDYDYNDSTGKSYDAEVGWLNMKWHDNSSYYADDSDTMKDYWAEYDDNVEWERENR